MTNTKAKIYSLISRNALFVVNHSGGKDSQAMLHLVRQMVPEEQILVVHAHLPGVEWEGTSEHIQKYLNGLAYRECQSRRTLLQMVKERGMFPSPQQRQCTSDLKRGPIEKAIRHYLKEHPEFKGLIVNCMGMRAQESHNRAKLNPLKINQRNSKAGREWYDWLPIHDLTTDQVFKTIKDANQKPHWAYAAGMSRLSCCFCIMASKADLTTAAKLNPNLYAKYVALEHSIGQTMFAPDKSGAKRTLEEITGVKATI